MEGDSKIRNEALAHAFSWLRKINKIILTIKTMQVIMPYMIFVLRADNGV